jgi:hypothetical protein
MAVSGKIVRIVGEGLRRLDTGKTDSSERTVPLPEFARIALLERRGRPFWRERRMSFPRQRAHGRTRTTSICNDGKSALTWVSLTLRRIPSQVCRHNYR